VAQRELHRGNDVPVQLSAYPTRVLVVTDGPLSFPVGVVDSWRVLLPVSVGEAVELFILEEAADQEDDIRLQYDHPELIEEEVALQVLIQFLTPLLIPVAQSHAFQNQQKQNLSQVKKDENLNRPNVLPNF
tara:strand:+ start:917 stop:1309 length:393 start_codon:yes stop_codon:yes gene_type:complete